MTAIIIVPGLGDSGPGHWQTWLQARERTALRVTQDEWSEPDLERWSARVRQAIDLAVGPVWLVAHSFGCLASVEAVAERPDRVAGALLVAPADPVRVGVEDVLPRARLAVPSLLVASTTDPWLKPDSATHWANLWGSRLVNLGAAGHINVDSGYGPWPEGQALLRQLQERYAQVALPVSTVQRRRPAAFRARHPASETGSRE